MFRLFDWGFAKLRSVTDIFNLDALAGLVAHAIPGAKARPGFRLLMVRESFVEDQKKCQILEERPLKRSFK